MKKILIVSTFPPRKCGIGTYAYSQAKHYKNLGYEVFTLGLGKDSSSFRKLYFNKEGIKNTSKWLVTQHFDEIHLHFVDGFFNFDTEYLVKTAFFKLLKFRTDNFIIVLHEIIPKVKNNAARLTSLSFADEIHMHTEKEKLSLEKIYKDFKYAINLKIVDKKLYIPFKNIRIPSITIVDHDRYFTPHFMGSKAEARKLLNLEANKNILVTLGFIQRHKGFDRVVDAMNLTTTDNVELYIVGSKREEARDIVEYYNELESKVKQSKKSIKILNKFISDEEFDIWVKAADALVLPYREIWSSGVGARAKLLNCPVIVSGIPTLVDQVKDQNHYIFNDVGQLAKIINQLPTKIDNQKIKSEDASLQKNTCKKNILVIAPVLTPKFIGGAEIVIKDFISILSESGKYNVTVVSTQSDSIDEFNNKVRMTDPSIFGWNENVVIKRFYTITLTKKLHRWSHKQYSKSSNKVINGIWKYSGLTGIGLINYVKKHINYFDNVYIPHYLYPVSHRLIGLTRNNIIHPFIHDEPALDNINNKYFFQNANSVIVNSEAEKVILDKHNIPVFVPIKEIGNRVEEPKITDEMLKNQENILESFGVKNKSYIFYVGRISKMKNVDDLIHWHQTLLSRTSLNIELIIAGKGNPIKVANLSELPNGIKYIGFISDDEKTILVNNALAVAQLSVLESFSLVMVESWLMKTPVIVNPNCLPIKYNFIKSQSAGELASNESEYIKAIESLVFLSKHRYNELGMNGYSFAKNNFVKGIFESKLISQFN